MQFSRKIKKWILIITWILGLTALVLVGVARASSSLVVIGNPKIKVSHLTKDQVVDLYLSEPASLKSNERLQPYDQPSNSVAYQLFYKSLLGWDSNRLSSYWSSLIFTGQASQPPTVASDAAAIAAVEQVPNTIAYVMSNSLRGVGKKVKVLYGNYKPAPIQTNNAYYHSMSSGNMASSQRHSGYHSMYQAPRRVSSSKQNKKLQAQLAKELTTLRRQRRRSVPRSHAANQKGNVWNTVSLNLKVGDSAKRVAVKHEILWYLDHRKILNLMLNNASPYIYDVYQQVQKRHMPALFALLPMVESGYNPFAYSHAGAAGLWQMMPGTASSYGLDINWWYDARRDLLTSTNAALNYLVRLHNNLGQWYLAAAAYDAGQGAVSAAIEYNKRVHRSTQFWSLPLSNETKKYVPKLLALANIIKNHKRYGIQLPNVANRPYFVAFKMDSQLDRGEIAKLAGVSTSIIHHLNPGLRRWATRPDGDYILLIPAAKAEVFRRHLSHVSGKTHISWQYHEVRRKETLHSIAKNYHTSVTLLRKVNGLKSNRIHAKQGVLVPLWLNKKYKNPLNKPLSIYHKPKVKSKPKTVTHQFNTSAVSHVSATKLLSGLHKTAPKKSKSTIQHHSSARSVESKDVLTVKKLSSKDKKPISKNDSLKTLVSKIYQQ